MIQTGRCGSLFFEWKSTDLPAILNGRQGSDVFKRPDLRRGISDANDSECHRSEGHDNGCGEKVGYGELLVISEFHSRESYQQKRRGRQRADRGPGGHLTYSLSQ